MLFPRPLAVLQDLNGMTGTKKRSAPHSQHEPPVQCTMT